MLSKKPTLLRSLSKTGRQLQRPPKPVNLKEQQRTNRSKSRSNTSRSGSRNRRLRLEKAKPEGASSANVITNRLPPIEDPGSGRGRAFAIRPHHRIHSKSPTRRFEKRGQEALRSISLDKAKIVEHLYIV